MTRFSVAVVAIVVKGCVLAVERRSGGLFSLGYILKQLQQENPSSPTFRSKSWSRLVDACAIITSLL